MSIPLRHWISVIVLFALGPGCGVKGVPLPPIVMIPEKSDFSVPIGPTEKLDLDIVFKYRGETDEFQVNGAFGETIQVVRPHFRYEITPELLEKGKPQILIKTRIFKATAKSKKPWKQVELVTLDNIGASFGAGFRLSITPRLVVRQAVRQTETDTVH